MSDDAYSGAGVDQARGDAAVEALVKSLRATRLDGPSVQVPLPGHYASVIRLDDRTGLAMSTDTVGTKMIVAEQLGRFDTIGIDCVAMNANDVVCVGAEPIAMLDFILCADADPEVFEALGAGLARGAELAGVEITGGEVAQVGEIVSGHELGGTCVGTVALDAIVTGERVEPGDAVIGPLLRTSLQRVHAGSQGARGGVAGRRSARAAARRRSAGAHRDVRPRSARRAALRGRRPRARAHHRRRLRQPAAPGRPRRLRDRRPAGRCRRCST